MRPQVQNQNAFRVWLLALALLGALVPHAAHAVHAQCWIYLPAHFAPLIAGLALGWRAGLLVGLSVAVSEVLGGHMALAQLVPLLCELITYGLAAGLVSSCSRGVGTALGCLLIAQLAGRLAYLAPALLLGKPLVRSLRGLFIAPWPGLLLQILLIPLLARGIARQVAETRPGVPERID